MKRDVFLHADLDAFFASVEQADDPSLMGKPTIVGALPGRRGVVSACSYEARKYGIHSAMPVAQAYRLCPKARFLPVRMKRYIEISEQVMDFLEEFTPQLLQISIDEAFLDLTGTERLMGSPIRIAESIKKNIVQNFNLKITIGVAPNKYCAKLASSYCKPDGLFEVRPGEEQDFIDLLRIEDLWGVGEKTLLRLKELNITTIQELRSHSRELLSTILGRASSDYLYKAVRGIDPGIYPEQPKSQSISSERTFAQDCRDITEIKKLLLQLSDEILFRLQKQHKKAKTIVLKIRLWDFSTLQTQYTVNDMVCSTEELYRHACRLLDEKWDGKTPIRLVGLGAANVVPKEHMIQGELFENHEQKISKTEQAIYTIRGKYKDLNITKARLLNRDKKED